MFVQEIMRKIQQPLLRRNLRALNTMLLSRERPKLKEETRRRLEEFFMPYNQELAELLGQDLSHWTSTKSHVSA